MLSSCFLRKYKKRPRGCSFKKLSRIFDTDSNFQIRSNKHQQYLIARGYKPHKLSKRFYDAAKISKVISFLPEFNRLLPNLNKLIRNRSRLFCSDPKMTIAFHKNEFTKEVRT